jgi:hypothetical protein
MGWAGSDDAWYNLPNIDSSPAYNCVDACIYNIRTTGGGDGEVISGLVYTHLGSFPVLIPNASVYVTTEPPTQLSLRGLNFQSSPSAVFTITDSAGIYAFSDLNSNTLYWVTAVAKGFTYLSQDVMTGTSQDNQPTSGNVWGVNFDLTRPNRFYVDDDAPGDPGPGNPTISDPLENGNIQRPFDSIQEAIDLAIKGNEIEVAPGTYNEAINNFNGKAIHLYSIGGPDVTTINGTGHYHVVQCISGEGPDTVLDGFTITGGYADGPQYFDKWGGGMWNNLSNPTVINCTFLNNYAQLGGGMFNHYCSPTVINCKFILNGAVNGGAMYNYQSNPTVTDCTFSDHMAVESGGGMLNFASNPTVTNCSFIGNQANDHGSGMVNCYCGPTVTNCTFTSNIGSYDGSGMWNYNSSTKVIDCTFNNNKVTTNGGGMFNSDNSHTTVTNCVFTNNSAIWGGGMYNWNDSDSTVTNCTFSGNSADATGGGIINNSNSDPTVRNCILWGNSPDEIVNYDPPSSSATVTYSDIQGGWFGAGNINADPLFVDAIAGDLRLTSGSPCIDKGSNAAVPPGITTDLEGHPRIIDGDCDDIDVVDIGAYEFDLAYFGDFDNNCSVNFFDFSILARAWMTQEGEPGWDWVCDISDPPDYYIDWRDLAILCDNWLTTP